MISNNRGFNLCLCQDEISFDNIKGSMANDITAEECDKTLDDRLLPPMLTAKTERYHVGGIVAELAKVREFTSRRG